jgi:GTP cyclohydrolase I
LYSIFRWSNVASAKNQTMKLDNLVLDNHTELHNFHEEMGDNHVASSLETPLRDDAFNLSDDEKITKISHHFRQIMETIGLDLTDDSLNGTPKRVAKMFVKEIFKGLNPENKPAATMFENKFGYNQMLVEKNVSIFSTCEHHFLPIYGFAHIAYMSSGEVIGLSKLNRIAQYYAKRPQVQERLTKQISDELKEILKTDNVAVYIDAKHMCVQSRGVEDSCSSTVTMEYSGKFLEKEYRDQFLAAIATK